MIDPIDGTHSLRHRIPLFGTLLALLENDRPIVGVVSLPELGRIYHAARGQGAYRNHQRLEIHDVAGEEEILEEVIATGERRQFVHAGREDRFDRLMQRHPGVRTYCDCFGHGLVFDGSAGAMVDFDLRIWDVSASRIIVEEAGGRFELVDRREDSGLERYDVVFGKPSVVSWVLEQIHS